MSKKKHSSLFIYLTAAALSALICSASWPGFMSYDALYTLHQARSGMESNIYPATVTYLQMICDRSLPGPGLLFAFQNTLYLMASAQILVAAGASLAFAVPALLCLCLAPPILGALLVVWKDVGCMAFFMAAFACLYTHYTGGRRTWLHFALLFLFLASSYRFNALPAAIPLLVWWCNLSDQEREKEPPSAKRLRRCAIVVSTITLSFAATICLINNYRLPSLQPLPGAVFAAGQIFDLVGISKFSGKLYIPGPLYSNHSDFQAADAKNIYYPDSIEKSFIEIEERPQARPLAIDVRMDLQTKGRWVDSNGQQFTEKELSRLWWHAVQQEPAAFLRHRLELTMAFLCINRLRPFYPTHPQIDSNNMNVEFHPHHLTGPALAWIERTAPTPLSRPWVYYAGGLATLALLLWRRPKRWQASAVLLSSAFIGLLCIIPALPGADLRYHIWFLSAILMAFILTLKEELCH